MSIYYVARLTSCEGSTVFIQEEEGRLVRYFLDEDGVHRSGLRIDPGDVDTLRLFIQSQYSKWIVDDADDELGFGRGDTIECLQPIDTKHLWEVETFQDASNDGAANEVRWEPEDGGECKRETGGQGEVLRCKVRQATVGYVGGRLVVQLKGEDSCRTALVFIAILLDDVKTFFAWVKNRREHRDEWGEPRFYGPEGSGIEIGYDDTSRRLGACGALSFFNHGAGLVIDTWPEDLDVLQEFAAGLGSDVPPRNDVCSEVSPKAALEVEKGAGEAARGQRS